LRTLQILTDILRPLFDWRGREDVRKMVRLWSGRPHEVHTCPGCRASWSLETDRKGFITRIKWSAPIAQPLQGAVLVLEAEQNVWNHEYEIGNPAPLQDVTHYLPACANALPMDLVFMCGSFQC
jgi:hypothetical protein